MARGGEMQVVELDDAPETVPAEPAEPAGRPRHRWRRVAVVGGVVALVGAALAGGQWVVDARERAAVEALAGIRGVIAPIDGDLEVLRSVPRSEISEMFGGSGDVSTATDGSQSFQWFGAASEEAVWTAPLLGPTPALAYAEGEDQAVQTATSCQPDGDQDEVGGTNAARYVVCLVSDGGEAIDDEDYSAVPIPATSTRLVVLDTADGTVVTDRATGKAGTFAIVPGLAVTSTYEDDRAVITAYELATGDQRWQTFLPPSRTRESTEGRGWRGAYVSATGDRLVVQSPPNRLTVISVDGEVVRDLDLDLDRNIEDWWVDDSTSRLLYSIAQAGAPSTLTLVTDDADPSKDRTLDGSRVYVGLDDGSVPGLVLTSDDQLHGWDAASGQATWFTTTDLLPMIDQAMVLRGNVYVTSGSTLAAVDGESGEVLWTAALEPGLTVRGMLTDGRNVLVELDSDDGGEAVIVGYERSSGEEAVRAAYPDGIDQVFPDPQGHLLGYDSAAERYVALG